MKYVSPRQSITHSIRSVFIIFRNAKYYITMQTCEFCLINMLYLILYVLYVQIGQRDSHIFLLKNGLNVTANDCIHPHVVP